ncbi:hypothetical protein, partial [Cellulomonas rhizosphaerae]
MTDLRPPLVIEVFDKSFVYQSTVAAPIEISATARLNNAGSATFTVASDEECVEDLLTAGARARVLYRADPAENPR